MMTPENINWTEGPHIRFGDKGLAQLAYLTEGGIKVVERSTDPEAKVVTVSGVLREGEGPYVLQRTLEPQVPVQEGLGPILLIGDIHGHFTKLVKFLQANKVIDEQHNWCWGKGHLVMCGDVMDRGVEVLPLLWLLCRLEQQAQSAGGALHVLLGNHELMVLQHDYRYVHPILMQLYSHNRMTYGAAFGPDWYLGQWLRNRNAVLKLNGLLISHAGVSPAVAQENLSIPALNSHIRAALDKPQRNTLEEQLLSNNGPLWYRGYVLKSPYYNPASARETSQVLEQYGATHLVVAHTPVDAIQQRLQGRVWAVDLDIESPSVGVQGLLYENEEFFILNTKGSKKRATTS